MSAAKLTLELDFDFDFFLLGIRTDLPDYRLAYQLNRLLSIQLKRSKKDLLLEGSKGSTSLLCSYFEFQEEDYDRDWFLASNKGFREGKREGLGLFSGLSANEQTDFLLPELKKFDFLFVVHGLHSPKQEKEIEELAQTVPQVVMVKAIDLESVKNREHLLFLDQ